MATIKEAVTALVKAFNGGGTVDEVIGSAIKAGVPVKDAARDWYLSTDAKLSKNKATALAKDACTVWWASKGKASAAARVSDLSETHYLSVEKEHASGAITQKYLPLPRIVVKHQGDVARLACMVQKLEAANAELRKALEAKSVIICESTESIKPTPAG